MAKAKPDTATDPVAEATAAAASDPTVASPPEPAAPEAPAGFRVHAVRATAGQGWLGIAEHGFVWVPDVADALGLLDEGDARKIAHLAFPGTAIEVVSE